jgi:hypothetical protein
VASLIQVYHCREPSNRLLEYTSIDIYASAAINRAAGDAGVSRDTQHRENENGAMLMLMLVLALDFIPSMRGFLYNPNLVSLEGPHLKSPDPTSLAASIRLPHQVELAPLRRRAALRSRLGEASLEESFS